MDERTAQPGVGPPCPNPDAVRSSMTREETTVTISRSYLYVALCFALHGTPRGYY